MFGHRRDKNVSPCDPVNRHFRVASSPGLPASPRMHCAGCWASARPAISERGKGLSWSSTNVSVSARPSAHNGKRFSQTTSLTQLPDHNGGLRGVKLVDMSAWRWRERPAKTPQRRRYRAVLAGSARI